jgi:gliding motility-associated-like protein
MNGSSQYFHDAIAVIPVNDIEKRNVNLAFNTNYSFYVIDENNDGFCFSNIRTINTNIPAKPKFINADGTKIVDKNHIQFSFTKDSILGNYYILRSDTFNGPYVKIDSIFGDRRPTIIYPDSVVDALSKIYYYKVEALNSCKIKINESDTASTIILKGKQNGNVVNLSWNSYQKLGNKIMEYTVYRLMQGGTVSSSIVSDTFATDRLDTVAEKRTHEISYYVVANTMNNLYGISGRTTSNTLTITIIQNITMPDFFTPNGDGKNDYYKAPIAFLAKSFKFIVYDRWGSMVFETNDSANQGWDGKVNGSAAPQGAYIYYLKIVGSDNVTLEQRGTFLLVLP